MPNAGSPARVAALVSCVLVACAACSSGNPTPATGGGGSGGGTGQAGATAAAGTGGPGTAGTTGSAGTSAAAGGAGSSGGGGTGAAGSSAAAGSGGQGPTDGGTDGSKDSVPTTDAAVTHFSFFVTSLVAMRRLSKSQNGFGGDLRYGETTGLAGADKICRETAENSMAGAGAKGWHAFLSAATGPGGQPVDAVDRIGNGPWYDRLGRVVALTKTALLMTRPMGADPAILNDLPNEFGVPNERPDPALPSVDNHHVLTGSDTQGRLYNATATCLSWTSTTAGRPRIGFSFIAGNRFNWISGQDEGGCGAGVNLAETGGSDPNNPIVGSGGGYGAIYCLADVP